MALVCAKNLGTKQSPTNLAVTDVMRMLWKRSMKIILLLTACGFVSCVSTPELTLEEKMDEYYM